VEQAEAAVQQAQASIQNGRCADDCPAGQIKASQSQLELAQAALVFAKQQAARYEALAKTGTAPFKTPAVRVAAASAEASVRPRWKITICTAASRH